MEQSRAATHFPFSSLLKCKAEPEETEAEEAWVVMEEGPDDYASVSDPITSGSPVAESERERAPTAVNSLDCAAHKVYDPLTYKVFASRYFLFAAIPLL